MFISYNLAEQTTQKDLCARMVLSKLRWEKLAKKLQKKIKSKFLINKTMCKNKWNVPNSDYKNLQIIIQELESIHVFGIYLTKKKKVPFT
jgi:hypothetical protein